MVTSSSVDRAGCSARKIFPGGDLRRSSPRSSGLSTRASDSLTRSAETASSAGSSRTKSALVAISGLAASRDPAGWDVAPVTMNWPETLRAELVSGNEVCARANSGKSTAQKTDRRRKVASWHRGIVKPLNGCNNFPGQRCNADFIFCRPWARALPEEMGFRLWLLCVRRRPGPAAWNPFSRPVCSLRCGSQ